MKRNKFNWIVFIILTVLMLTILLMDHLKVFPLVDKRKYCVIILKTQMPYGKS